MPRKKSAKSDPVAAKLSLYIPTEKGGTEVLARLRRLARDKGRSVNYLVVGAILAYLKQMEQKA
ncbi:MAG: hypothetical protein NUV94_06820 [Candidatus Acetothermia bacterium]|nr:hypothetical protein [Candidatus Acetothermia bacterium]